jgi:hypothetical protein
LCSPQLGISSLLEPNRILQNPFAVLELKDIFVLVPVSNLPELPLGISKISDEINHRYLIEFLIFLLNQHLCLI